MTEHDHSRPIAGTPVTDASTASMPDETARFASNADLRVSEEDEARRNAAITATGEDVDNDHADERPFDRSQDSEASRHQQEYAEQDYPDQQQQQEQRDGQFDPTE
jgi:hypothetical protein